MKTGRFEHITTTNEFLILNFVSIVVFFIVCGFIVTGYTQTGEAQVTEPRGRERYHDCVRFRGAAHHGLLLLRLCKGDN